jgi:hypothetical protein
LHKSPIHSNSQTPRLDAKEIISQAKRFQDYELGGHGVQKNRVPYGSALNNFNIVDLKKKI